MRALEAQGQALWLLVGPLSFLTEENRLEFQVPGCLGWRISPSFGSLSLLFILNNRQPRPLGCLWPQHFLKPPPIPQVNWKLQSHQCWYEFGAFYGSTVSELLWKASHKLLDSEFSALEILSGKIIHSWIILSPLKVVVKSRPYNNMKNCASKRKKK